MCRGYIALSLFPQFLGQEYLSLAMMSYFILILSPAMMRAERQAGKAAHPRHQRNPMVPAFVRLSVKIDWEPLPRLSHPYPFPSRFLPHRCFCSGVGI
jgi:hypothetical protein